jgi:hypothetical protein
VGKTIFKKILGVPVISTVLALMGASKEGVERSCLMPEMIDGLTGRGLNYNLVICTNNAKSV